MKTFFKIQAFAFITSLMLWGCTKEETKIFYEGGTPPVLTSTEGAEVSFTNKDKFVLTLNWTNPDYMFTTGVSSHDVNYNIEIDTLGSNFSNPAKKVIIVNQDLEYRFTGSEMNDIMLNQLGLLSGVEHTLEIRVSSSLVNNSAKLTSNSVTYVSTPFAIPPKVTPPATGELFITGSASEKGWMSGGDADVPSQKFTQVTETLYELTAVLNGGGSYLFVPDYGNWDKKYGTFDKNDPNTVYGGDFKAQGEDILAPAETGTYKIQVDFQKGKFTVTKQ